MNKVFKVIWNHATQTWTAVSELGHAKGKTKSKKIVKLTALAGAVIGSLAASQSAIAATDLRTNDAVNIAPDNVPSAQAGRHAVSIGPAASAKHQDAIAIGHSATANWTNTISIGNNTLATQDHAVAIGSNTTATGVQSVTLGSFAGATANLTIAVGAKANATKESAIAVGSNAGATGDNSVALGQTATASNNNAIAIGTKEVTSGNNAVGIGAFAESSAERSTALGMLSQAKGKGSFAGGASAQATGENSVAIGGAQDGTLKDKAGTAAKAIGNQSIAVGTQSIANGENSIAQGKGANAALENSIAIGTNATASGISIGNEASTIIPDSIAIGHKSNVDGGAEGVAIGNEATNGGASFAAAVGATSGANANYSVALGYNAVANAEYSVALGAASEAGDDFVESTNATINGIEYKNFAASSSQFNNLDMGMAGAVVSVGTKGYERQIKNVAAGQVTKLSTDAINGSQLYAVADSLATKINKQHWNVGNNAGDVVSGVYHEDQVNFVNGNVTTVKVVKAPSKTSMPDGGPNITNVSYDVNVGKGLKIDGNKIVTNIVAGKGVTFNTNGDEITINAQSSGGAASSVVSGNENTLNVTTNASNPSEYIVTPVTGSLSVTPKGKIDEDAQGFEDNGQKLTTIQTTRDMVNKAHWNLQIAESSNPTNKGTAKITTENKTAAPVHAGDTVNIFAGKNINLERTGTDITISAKDASVDTGEIIPATNTTNTNNNGTVMAKDGDGDKFANITNVVNAINSAFWKIGEENSGTVTPKGNVTAGSQVNFSNGVGTIAKVTADEANKTYKVQYDINAGPGIEIPTDENDPNKGKVTVKVDNSTVTINDDGQLVANSAWNANATGNVDGTSAVKTVKANATVNFDAGENLKVKQTGDEANQVYSFSLNQTLTNITSIQNKATGPKLTFGNNSINITGGNLDMGNNQITNLKPGVNGTDAVNLDQLKASRTNVTSTDNSVTVTSKTDANTHQTTYDLSVNLSNVAKSSWNVKSSAEGGAVAANHNATAKNITDSNTVEFKAGKNLTVEQVNGDTGANVTFALSNNITLDNNGSIKIGDTNITNGAVSNLTTHLESPVKVDGDVANATKTADLSANLTNTTAPDYKGKDAATVEDVLKAGWNLQANGKAVDAVTHGNNVNFASDGSVKITPTTDGNTTTLNLSVNATSIVNQVTGDVSANTTTGKAVVGKGGNEDTSADAGNKVATVGDVANTINNTGWITKTTDGANVTVNPGDRVEYVDGKGTKANVTVNSTTGQDVVNVTYDVKTDGKTVTVNNDGNLTVVTGNITKASDDVTNSDAGKVTVNTGDDNKVATVKNVVDAINSAGWIVNTGKAADQNSFTTVEGTATKVGAGDKVNFQAGKNLEVRRDGNNITYATSEDLDAKNITVTTVKVGKDGKDGVDGSIGVTGKDGAAVAINGKDGSIGLTGPKGADGKDGASVTIKPEKGTTTVAERDGGKEINRVTYTDKDKDGNDIKREIATLDDGLKFTGDDGQTVNRTLGSNLNVKGGATTSTTAKNIRVTKAADGQGLDVNLANNVTLNNDGSLNIGGTTVKDGDIKIGNTHITNGAVSNLTTHLVDPVKVDGDVENATKTADLAANLTTPTAADYRGKDAATVEDVLKAGWNLQANGQPVDAVTHGNNVNFASDNSVKITPTTDGNTSTINLSVNATNVVEQVTGNVSANMTTGKAVVGKDGNEDTSANAGNKVATVGDVANTINNTGWITKTTDGANVTVNPGDRVEYVDGKGTKANVTVNSTTGQDIVNVTYDVKTDGTTVTVNNDGNLTVVTGNITKASDDVTQPNAGKVTVTTGDENKVATVKNVADAINSAGWIVNTGKADNQDSFKTETGTPTKVGAGDNVNFQAGKNLEVKRDGQNIIYATSEDLDAKTITVTTVKVGNDGKDGKPGVDGSIGVTGKDGAAVAINGKDGSIGLTGPKGADGKDGASVTIKPEKGTTTVAERDGGKEINRVTYTDKDKDGNDIKREIATLDDGLKFTGDDGQTVNRTLGSNLNVKGGATTSTTAKNIRVTKAADGQGLDVNLANNIELDNNGSIKIGDTTVNQDGITINNGPSVTKGGIDAGGKTITNVAPGKNGTDAVNVDQLRGSLTNIQGDIHKARKEGRAGIAGANAAAGLPQVYLPGKSMVAASAGTFKGQNALAVGYSRSSDNGKVIFKLQGNANTQGDVGGSVGIGYQW